MNTMTVASELSAAHAPLGLEDIQELMESVQAVTSELQRTHVTLQAQVTDLQGELAAANAQLRRSRSLAALGEMAAGIAHEIRNPLGSIQLYTQMLGEDVADRPDQSALCVRIQGAVEHLDAIVRDVLAFARDIRVRPTRIDAADLLDRAIVSCDGVARTGGATVIRMPVPDVAAQVTLDVHLVTMALANLIRNAIEAIAESGATTREVRVSVNRARRRRPDGTRAELVVLGVEDTGPGIPADVVSRMFNPFFTTRPSGTGLGLAIVHRIIDAHGGHVHAGAGATGGALVELCLPLRPPTLPQAHPDIDTTGVSLNDSVNRRLATEAAP
ncbi:MAG: hypothetical protein KDA25_11800 [Phycisphaerales bacterium]|nr:hypothetical protein [Phycisphaerales bacterium]